ncbi:helix-turn-helix domain-containing protein [Roseateles sp. MS654]
MSSDERVAIAGLKTQGCGAREIGRRLDRSAGTISRGPGRNTARGGH